jgi:uncharacterized radical SAM superfamily Fe-S cluster-containing enzyme
MKENLNTIGFYTLSDERVKTTCVNSQMKRCEMIITEYCNFKCPYCRGLKNEIYGDRKIKELSLEEIKHNIDLWCENVPLENIRFSGGEPTLHKNIVDVVKYAKEKGIKRIFSRGTFSHHKSILCLISSNESSFIFLSP